jgi:cell division GTPase FtsZ
VEFIVANTDAQALAMSKAPKLIQLGAQVTQGLGAGSLPEVGQAAADESIDEIMDHLSGTHMCFVTAGMGGGTGTGAAPVIAEAARRAGILTVAVVTKPFAFEGRRRMQMAEAGIERLRQVADTVIVIPNQNLFRVADAKTTFADAFVIADRVLYSGVGCITDLIVKEGLINLDFADVRSVMRDMGRAMMGTGEAKGDGRAACGAGALVAFCAAGARASPGRQSPHAIRRARPGGRRRAGAGRRPRPAGDRHRGRVAAWRGGGWGGDRASGTPVLAAAGGGDATAPAAAGLTLTRGAESS